MRVFVRTVVALVLGACPMALAEAQQRIADAGGKEAAARLLEMPAQLDVRNITLTAALTQLSEASGVVVAFSPTLLNSDHRRVDCACRELTVSQALDRLLSGLGFRYSVRDGQVILTPVVPPASRHAEPAGPARTELALAALAARQPLPHLEFRSAPAPQEPVVSGTVVDQGTQQPVADARVAVAGSARAATTDARGQFRLGGLTGQEVTLEVIRIGYRRLIQTVRVGALDLRLVLQPQVVNLDEVIVTGTAGGQEVRALGNAVTRVDVTGLEEIAPAVNLQGILATRVPGLAIQSAGGNVGAGGVFRIRGASSLALSSNPLIYVDGVRVDNNNQAGTPRALNDCKIGNDCRFAPSRVNDLNPDEIESIQVVKGPAAATLYGTEASNGVIQIVTRRGSSGRPTVQLTAKQGATWIHSPETAFPHPYYRSSTGEIVEFNVLEYGRKVGFPVSLYGECPRPYREEGGMCKGNVFSTGMASAIGGSVSGGAETVKYFFSADFDRDEGTVSYNWQNRLSGRGNLTWAPNDKLGIDVGIGYTRSKTRSQAPMQQPITAAIIFACFFPGCEPGSTAPLRADGPWRGFQFLLPERLENDAEAYDELDRAMVNGTARYRPFPWFSHRLTVGGDFSEQRLSGLARKLDGAWRLGTFRPDGQRGLFNRGVTYASADYATTAAFRVGSGLGLETSAGLQYYRRRTTVLWSLADNLSVGGLGTLSAGSVRTTDEEYIENKTFGAYAQQQLSWKNRFFLTGGLRGDDNSAFGTDFDFVLYPKLAASWVVSDEPFFQSLPGISTLKLRAAWGKAGQQPDAYVALQTYRPYIGGGGATGLTTDNFGNPELKPEVGREIEVGFDAGLFNERVGVEFTYYHKRTSDAIIPVALPPSTGFAGTRLLNLGAIVNKGTEIALSATAYRSRGLTVDLRSAVSFNSNEVESLGPGRASLFASQFNQFHVPGFPVGAFFARRVVSATVSNGVASNVMCESGMLIEGTNLSRGGGAPVPCAQAPEVYMGGVLPTWQGASSITVAVGGRLQLFGQVDYIGGHYQRQAEVASANTGRRTKAYFEGTDPILLGAFANTFDSRLQLGLMNLGFARVRDLSATYALPDAWARRFGTSQMSLTASLRNLWFLWRKQPTLFGHPYTDPEVRFNGTFYAGDPSGGLAGNVQDAWPIPRRFLLTLRTTF